jgi:hypothetical protein
MDRKLSLISVFGLILFYSVASAQPVPSSKVDVSRVGGTAVDANSGVKSAGTQRVVIATDQPQLTNKLLVTPDSVALPANQSVNQAQTGGVATSMNSGVTDTGTQRVTISSDSTGQVKLATGSNTIGALTANQSTNVAQVAGTTADTNSGTKSAGTLRVVLATDQPALTNKLLVTPDSVALPANQSVNVSQIAGGTAISSGVTGSQAVGGDTASAASDAGNPIKIGAVAKTANPTAVTDGQRVNVLADKLGKIISVPAIRDLKGVQKTTIISSAAETTIITSVASTFLDLYALIITNSSATAASCTIKDATGGTTRLIMTIPAGEDRGFAVEAGSAMPQAVAANNWTATCTSVASIEITAMYVKNL